jgi:signal peptidase I
MAFYKPPELSASGWFRLAIYTIIGAVILRVCVVQTFAIPSHSMEPNLEVGDYILVNQLCYDLHVPLTGESLKKLAEPERGDVVVFTQPGNDEEGLYFVKRVVGLPGELIELKGGAVFVEGRKLSEDYLYDRELTYVADEGVSQFRVDEEEYFVLGDNRDDSFDSRYFGAVRRSEIQGCAQMIYWSWENTPQKTNVHWARIGNVIGTGGIKGVGQELGRVMTSIVGMARGFIEGVA